MSMLSAALSSLAFVALFSTAPTDTTRIYGRITTQNGETYEGFIRWDRNETNWSDILHASKQIPEENVRLSDELLGRRRAGRTVGFSILGVRFDVDSDDDYPTSASSGIRFGHILTLERTGSGARLVLISGAVVELRPGGDLGPDMRGVVIEDREIGEISLKWRDIDRVDFFNAPAGLRSRSGERLYGTVRTSSGGSFTGYIAWDVDETLTTDILDGKERGRSYEIRFGDIASIEQRGNASLVTLRSGRKLLLSGTNDVNNSNRGIVVTEPTFGQARISWRNFDRLDLHSAPASAPGDNPVAFQRRIHGTVHTVDDERLSGAIRWDNDEEFAWELLNGDADGAELEIEFGAIREIERRGDGARVTLRDGRSWVLRGSNDVGPGHKGIFVTRQDGSVAALPWDRIRSVVFD